MKRERTLEERGWWGDLMCECTRRFKGLGEGRGSPIEWYGREVGVKRKVQNHHLGDTRKAQDGHLGVGREGTKMHHLGDGRKVWVKRPAPINGRDGTGKQLAADRGCKQ